MSGIASAFSTLKSPGASSNREATGTASYGVETLSACVVPGLEPHRIGRDTEGRAVLLISSASSEPHRADLALERIEVRFGAQCKIVGEDNSNRTLASTLDRVEHLTLVRCLDRALTTHFLGVSESVLRALGPAPSPSEVAAVIERLVRLFEAASRPARSTVQGLWAELLLLRASSDPVVLASAWHARPEERFDFALGIVRVEVKSTSGPERVHHFSLGQLRPASGVEVIIASVMVPPTPDGTTLGSLIADVRQQLFEHDDLALSVDQTVAATLGSALPDALGEAFDEAEALRSLAYYHSLDIPSVSPEVPASVSDVRFRADLSTAPKMDLSEPASDPSYKRLYGALPKV